MATLALNAALPNATSYTVPALRRFIGSLMNSTATSAIISVNGVSMFTIPGTSAGVAVQPIGPVAFQAGDVVLCACSTAAGAYVTLFGQLFDA